MPFCCPLVVFEFYLPHRRDSWWASYLLPSLWQCSDSCITFHSYPRVSWQGAGPCLPPYSLPSPRMLSSPIPLRAFFPAAVIWLHAPCHKGPSIMSQMQTDSRRHFPTSGMDAAPLHQRPSLQVLSLPSIRLPLAFQCVESLYLVPFQHQLSLLLID